MKKSEAKTILGVGTYASQEEIKNAWRKKSLIYHPDKAENLTDLQKQEFNDMYKKIQEAYETLRVIKQSNQQENQDTYYKSRGETYDEFKKRKSKERQEQQERAKRDRDEKRQDRESREKQDRERKKREEEVRRDKERKKREEEVRRDKERKKREEAIRILKEEKISKRKTQMQTVLFVITILSIIIITNPFNFGVNETSVPSVVVESPEPRDPMPIGSLEPEPAVEPEKLELLPISKFILTGSAGNPISDEDCTIFERKFDLNQEDAIYFGRYDEFRCAKAIIVFDLADLQNKLLTEQTEIKDNMISFEQLEKPIETLHCNGINLHPNDRHDPPNCNHTNDYAFELKFKFSDDRDCGPPNETFTELESWDKVVDWSNTKDNLNIYDIIVSELSAGQYLCLAFSEEGTDKTGDRHQYFKLYALTDLKINVFFVDEDR